ncbi:DUF4236 domain-containing protein [Stenotrophomonas rhizophila]|uniref:DUF4236 domain-containing protein n=1 Tax=Stenotrophomonas rhizophila TaxID=216778 RepID=UPI001AEBCAF5|nr:DUF4236 domain-containing protein [Stenotrophomonas rhizophila]
MGLYLRKSVTVGPLRFNLSKGGVGVSAGIKGFRVGTGPRGNYVHMGAGGIYYRATIPSRSTRPRPATPHGSGRPLFGTPPALPSPHQPPSISHTHGPMVDINSADATTIVDSSSQALLDELNAKKQKWRLWPGIAALSVVVFLIAAANQAPNWALVVLAILGGGGIVVAHLKDQLRKTVVLMYELDEPMEQALEALHAGASALASVSAAWHVSSHAKVFDQKYHAGAGTVVDRKLTRFIKAPPPFVETNIQTFAVNVGAQTLHFFPDRVLIYDSNGVGAVSYQGLQVLVSSKQFVEQEAVPNDATVIGRTWRYVNKNGGPDRRFKDNREIPVCQYEQVALRSDTGLNELLQVSRLGAAADFASAIARLSRIRPKELL